MLLFYFARAAGCQRCRVCRCSSLSALIDVYAADIDARFTAPSAMPPMKTFRLCYGAFTLYAMPLLPPRVVSFCCLRLAFAAARERYAAARDA